MFATKLSSQAKGPIAPPDSVTIGPGRARAACADDAGMGARIDHRTGLEELDRDECLDLLAGTRRSVASAVVVGGRPLVFP